MKLNYLFLILAAGLMGPVAQAQVRLNHVSAGVSYWNRSYANEDERALFAGYTEEDDFTTGAMMPHLGAELNFYKAFALEARVASWNREFSSRVVYGSGLTFEEKIAQQIYPVSLGLVYNFKDLFLQGFDGYTGAGLNRYFLKNEVERKVSGGDWEDSSGSFSGNSYGSYFKLGAEYLLGARLGISLEGRYHLGSYEQAYQTSGGSTEKYSVSLRGMEVGLSLRYHFGPKG